MLASCLNFGIKPEIVRSACPNHRIGEENRRRSRYGRWVSGTHRFDVAVPAFAFLSAPCVIFNRRMLNALPAAQDERDQILGVFRGGDQKALMIR
jgi:hypothetical protein